MERLGFVRVFAGFSLAFWEGFKSYFMDLFSSFYVPFFVVSSRERKILSLLESNICEVLGIKGRVEFKWCKEGKVAFFAPFGESDPSMYYLGSLSLLSSKSFSMERFLVGFVSMYRNNYVVSRNSCKKGLYCCSNDLIKGNADLAYSNIIHDSVYDEYDFYGSLYSYEYSGTTSHRLLSPEKKDYVVLSQRLQERLSGINIEGSDFAVFYGKTQKDLFIETLVCDIETHIVKDIDGNEQELVLLVNNDSDTKRLINKIVYDAIVEYEKEVFSYDI